MKSRVEGVTVQKIVFVPIPASSLARSTKSMGPQGSMTPQSFLEITVNPR